MVQPLCCVRSTTAAMSTSLRPSREGATWWLRAEGQGSGQLASVGAVVMEAADRKDHHDHPPRTRRILKPRPVLTDYDGRRALCPGQRIVLKRRLISPKADKRA